MFAITSGRNPGNDCQIGVWSEADQGYLFGDGDIIPYHEDGIHDAKTTMYYTLHQFEQVLNELLIRGETLSSKGWKPIWINA
jgi:hypothetical protein